MKKYSLDLINKVKALRSIGKTYVEITTTIGISVPQSTLFEWCKGVTLPKHYQETIEKLNRVNLGKARSMAVAISAIKKAELFEEQRIKNTPIAKKIHNKETAKIALAMLCLGEASKSKSKSSFNLGNSDPRIILIFLELLKSCFNFNIEKVRCTVQCRADQDTSALETFWQKVTKIPKKYFYKSQIDLRTVGKPTLKSNYKGVLRVDYLDKKVQLELESLADLIYNQALLGP
jgi:hypothetical protein